MKNLLTISLLVLLVACGGKGGSVEPPTPPVVPPPPPPVEGTVLSSECQEHTLVEQVADGLGGSNERITTRAPECGWNPEPYGTLSHSECRFLNLINIFHDGEYGFYEEEETDSEECGYIPPSLEVSIDNTYGDRFRPVVVTVDYRVQGEPAEWTFHAEAGRAVKVDDNTLHIFGTGEGNSVDFSLEINGESFLYQLKKEPRCTVEDSTDCLGYRQLGNWPLIYYSEDDTDVVDVEVLLTYYGDLESPVQVFEDDPRYQDAVSRVQIWNNMVARDDIYIRFIVKEVWRTPYRDLRQGESFTRSRPVDIGLGRGTTYPDTCGVAYPNTKFSKAGFGFSDCQYSTDLHELGHVVGLAHGPNNSSYPAEGYIFPEFGHGDYDQCIGGRTDDIMSYGDKRHFYNSRQDCADRFDHESDRGIPAGDRFRADSAYHWNRIRYDLSLIHDEHATKSPATARLNRLSVDDDRPLIVD